MYQLKKHILRLLEEDKEFRHAVAGIIGYKDILDRLEEHDRKFNEILAELKAHRQILDRHTAILEEHSRILGEHSRRLEEHDRKFNEMLEEIGKLRRDFTNLARRVEVTIGSMGRRWGIDMEKMVQEIFRETLERRGIEPGKVEKFRFKDRDGSVTGVKGKIVDVDVLVKDDKLYVIEVKSMAELDHVELLPEKAKTAEKVLGKPVQKAFIVAVNIEKEAYQRAQQLGIEVIAGNIIE